MAKPSQTVWEIEEHTKAKHRILRGYLDAWLPIMSDANRRLVYIDGFAGPGVYAGGEPGSPIIALKAYLEHKYRHGITAELVYAFIEEDEGRVARLREEVAKLGPLPDQVKVGIHHGAYEDIFSETLKDIERRGARLAPTFAFIDPFGYSQVSMTLAGRFLQFARCEVLIYVPFRFVARFVSRVGQEAALTTLFGTEDWRAAKHCDGEARLQFLHDLFQRQLKDVCGLEYVRSFETLTKQRNSGYHLFFGTKHRLGLEKMKEAMWRIDPAEGQRFADSTSSAQQTLFQPEPDTTVLRDAMMAHFGEAPFGIGEALDFTLFETPYLPTHVKTRTLKPLEKAGRLQVVFARDGRRSGTYPAGTRMRFVP